MFASPSFRLRALAPLVLLALAACGGGGGGSDSPAAQTNQVTVAPSLGKFSANTRIEIHDMSDKVIGTGTIGADGTATVDLGSYSGAFIVKVVGGAGVKYYDEAAGTDVDFPAGESIEAVVPDATSKSIAVTPLTDASAKRVRSQLGSLTADQVATKIKEANALIAQVFGVADVLVPPRLVDASVKDLKDDPKDKYALVLAALAGNGNSGKKAFEIAKDLAKDLADGVLDGKGTDGSAVTAFDSGAFVANINTALIAAAEKYADDATKERLKADTYVIIVKPTPVTPTQVSDLAKAKQMLSDVRVSALIAQDRLLGVSRGVQEAVTVASNNGSLAAEHYQWLAKGIEFASDIAAGRAPAAVNGQYVLQTSAGGVGGKCTADATTPAGNVTCTYGRNDRQVDGATVNSAFAFTLHATGSGAYQWDAFKKTFASPSATTATKVTFLADIDGTATVTYDGSGRAVGVVAKGDMPFGFGSTDNKTSLDVSGTLSSDANRETLTLKGTATTTLNGVASSLQIGDGSVVYFPANDGTPYGSLNLVAAVGGNAYTVSGTLDVGDLSVMPVTGKFTGSVSNAVGPVADVTANVTMAGEDANGPFGAASLKAVVHGALAENDVTVILGAKRDAATPTNVAYSLKHTFHGRTITVDAATTSGELAGVANLSNTDGVVVTVEFDKTTGQYKGTVKVGDNAVGTIIGGRANFVDGSSESLG
ncbi:hypothetical protein ABWL39_18210 [Chitinivorax sp. PXF-14]|uniref:hypothetical protein n=1 Tax=Chitinivorax sp. PXF-14 TaxID=3230488 RepID=UPI0034679CDF